MADEAGPGDALSRVLGITDRLLSFVERLVMAIVTTGLFVIMVMVALDAILRYTLNSPLIFNYDLVQMYLLPIVMLMPVGFLMRRGGHISVDLFAMMMPERMRQLVLGLALLASAPVFWIMFHRIGSMAIDSFEKGLGHDRHDQLADLGKPGGLFPGDGSDDRPSGAYRHRQSSRFRDPTRRSRHFRVAPA